MQCEFCQDPVDISEYTEHQRNYEDQICDRLLERPLKFCLGCYLELRHDQLPFVTDSRIPARGTGLTPRQRMGQRRTDGG